MSLNSNRLTELIVNTSGIGLKKLNISNNQIILIGNEFEGLSADLKNLFLNSNNITSLDESEPAKLDTSLTRIPLSL